MLTDILKYNLYSQGGAVLRMMEGFMGAENTQQGYIKYLSTFATKTATTNQLWDMMQPFAAGINITEVMQTWTGQRGFPLVNVDWIDNKLILTQTRFLANINATYNKSDTPFQLVKLDFSN